MAAIVVFLAAMPYICAVGSGTVWAQSELAWHPAPPSPQSRAAWHHPDLNSVGGAIAFGSAIALATLCLCLAAVTSAQRRLSERMEAALAGMEAVGQYTMGAAELSRGAAAGMVRLTEGGVDPASVLRGWMEQAQAGQERASTVLQRCTRLTETLPELVLEAIEASRARSQGAVDGATSRLETRLGELGGAVSAVWNGAQAISAGQEEQSRETGALLQRLEAAVGAVEEKMRRVSEVIAATGAEVGTRVGAQVSAQIDARLDAQRGAPIDARRVDPDEDAGRELHAALDEAGRRLTAGVARLDDVSACMAQAVSGCVEQAAAFRSALPAAVEAAAALVEASGLSLVQTMSARLQESALCLEAAAAKSGVAKSGAAVVQPSQGADLATAAGHAQSILSVMPDMTRAFLEAAASLKLEAQRGMAALAGAGDRMAACDAAASTLQAGVAAGIGQLDLAVEAQVTASRRLAAEADALAGTACLLDAHGQALATTIAAHSRAAAALVLRLEASDLPQVAAALGALPAEIGAAWQAAFPKIGALADARMTAQTQRLVAIAQAAQGALQTTIQDAMKQVVEGPGLGQATWGELAGLRQAVERVAAGFTELVAREAAQAHAASRVADARLAVEQAASARPLGRLHTVAQDSAALLMEASALARAAASGDAEDNAASVLAAAPRHLDEIEASIERLRSAARMLSVAQDRIRGEAA